MDFTSTWKTTPKRHGLNPSLHRRKMWWLRKVVVQHDGASAHTGKGAEDALRAAGGGRRMAIEIARQPPNSPDTNILDLCFNRSLTCRVSRLPTTNKARLVAAVAAEWQRYDRQTLEGWHALHCISLS